MIVLDHVDGVTRITLDRPAQRNALATADWERLADIVAGIPADGGPVLLRSSSPGIFCAGADLRDLSRLADEPERRVHFRKAMRAAVESMAALPMPVIAAIDGGCHGAGVALALAADIRIAGPDASFAIPPARLGIAYPASDVARLERRIGHSQAARLLFTGMMIGAEEARRIGLVDMFGDGASIADGIAQNDRAALAALKAMLRDPTNPGHALAFEESFANPRFRAATQRYR